MRAAGTFRLPGNAAGCLFVAAGQSMLLMNPGHHNGAHIIGFGADGCVAFLARA